MSKEVEQNYIVLKALGNGKFGQVSELERKVSKKRFAHFAWKQVNLEDPLSEVEELMLKRVSRVRHQNIVTLHQVFM